MSEIINNNQKRKELLKQLILQLHQGVAPDTVKLQLATLLKSVPYGLVVEAEQELIQEGLPEAEVMKLCDIHSQVLEESLDQSGAKPIPPGHPVDIFRQENEALSQVVTRLEAVYAKLAQENLTDWQAYLDEIRQNFNDLMDVDKHYQRKEYLLFPFLEKKGVTGPPKVMWGKHDEIRALLKNAQEKLHGAEQFSQKDFYAIVNQHLRPASQAIADMIVKENEILLPMAMDKLTEPEWAEIQRQTPEYGYCLYDPPVIWYPESKVHAEVLSTEPSGFIQLPTGRFSLPELTALLGTVPIDMTFVDKDDKVRWFSHGKHRIFSRSRAILGRDVRHCHPPASVHIVEQILTDFKSGKAERAPFWINMKGRFIHIEYFALRGENGEYLGTLEVSQDLTELRQLQGEQRLLSYK